MHQAEKRNNEARVPEPQSGRRKRKYPRAGVPGFVGDLAVGKKVLAGIVENISAGGFEIVNLPLSFLAEKFIYKVVLSGGGKYYKMLAKPCWRKNKGASSVKIGFKILDASWEWMELTMHTIPELDEKRNYKLQG